MQNKMPVPGYCSSPATVDEEALPQQLAAEVSDGHQLLPLLYGQEKTVAEEIYDGKTSEKICTDAQGKPIRTATDDQNWP